MFVLDTNVISCLMKPEYYPNLPASLHEVAPSAWLCTSVSLCEIYNGIQKVKHEQQRQKFVRRLDAVLADYVDADILAFGHQEAQTYNDLREAIRKQGLGIKSDYDIMIASQAIQLGATVVSYDQDFEYLKSSGLKSISLKTDFGV